MLETGTAPLSVVDAIQSRRSIRQYVQEPMSQDDLHEILRLTSLAPSSANTQTWRLVVIQNKDLQQQLRAVAYDQQQITGAPAVIVLYSDMEDVLAHAEDTIHPGMGAEQITARAAGMRQSFGQMSVDQRASWANGQANIALGFLLLAAKALGYGTSPMLGFMPDQVKTLLGLPPHAQIAAIVSIGKPAEDGFSHYRHSLDRIVDFRN
jgi:nitroreductase